MVEDDFYWFLSLGFPKSWYQPDYHTHSVRDWGTMSTRLASSLHKQGPVWHLSLTTDPLFLLHKSAKLNESKENQGETLRIVRYFHWLFIRKSTLIMIRQKFLFLATKVFLKLCLFVLLMKIREERVLCFSLALYVAMPEIPPFPISQA